MLETDVLIIGAGPSGLMAAMALAKLGVKVMIVDRRYPGQLYGNADGLQPRTLEIWQSYGILEKFLPRAVYVHALVTYERNKGSGSGLTRSPPIANVVVPSRYPFEMAACIEDIEGALRDALAETAHSVVQPAWPLSIHLRDGNDESIHPVTVVLQSFSNHTMTLNKDATSLSISPHNTIQTVRAKYVIGADGAHSWVRRQINVAMEGDRTEYIWGVVDAHVKTNFPDFRFKCVIQAASGAIIAIPREEEKVRFYVQLSVEEILPTMHKRLNMAELPPHIARMKILEPYHIEFVHVFWSTIFSVSQKIASHFSLKNRIFIVGDACHTHSPKAAQGANASMGDAHNLAWKISWVLRGYASPSLLETYEEERRKYAFELIELDKELAKSLDGQAASGSLFLITSNYSGIGICYTSRLSIPAGDTHFSHLQSGVRLPPHPITRVGDWHPADIQDLARSDGAFKLLIFPGDFLESTVVESIHDLAAHLDLLIPEITSGRLVIYTILNSQKADVCWNELPWQSWKRSVDSKIQTQSS
ncbi:FAD binding domain-containing protein [Infundibulicybe gibba]|nr:FAD binding domain-containing protein [Infundibulicybe gibba]